MGRWQEVHHTADLAVRVWAENLEDLFRTAAQAMFGLLGEGGAQVVITRDLALTAPDVEVLLVDWLNELLYLHEEAHTLFTDIVFTNLSCTAMQASVAGRALVEARAHIKAVTYHMLNVTTDGDSLTTEIVFDV